MNKHTKNKIRTAGYFIKRLRDNGFDTVRIYNGYSESDPRKWTVLVDPGNTSIFITCFENHPFRGEFLFKFDDGGQRFKSNYSLKTQSIEVVVSKLLSSGIPQSKQK